MKSNVTRGGGFRGALNYAFDVGQDATGDKNPELIGGTMSGTDPRALALAESLGGLEITTNAGLEADVLIAVTADDYSGPLGEASDLASTPTTTAAPTETPVGAPGPDFGVTEDPPEIDAGGDGPRCVN